MTQFFFQLSDKPLSAFLSTFLSAFFVQRFLSIFLSTTKTLKVLWNLIPEDLDIGSFRNSSGENESPAIGNYLQFPAELDPWPFS